MGKRFKLIALSLSSLMIVTTSFANDEQMRESIVQIINQIQAIKPLINKAEHEQSSNPRIKIHFDQFSDGKGKIHNGLRQDLSDIQDALIQSINRETVEPRRFNPLKDDFVGSDHV
jgi:RAQPRD family integrative conjugative element protein